MIVRRQPAAVVVGDHRAFGDGDQRVMRVVILARQEEGLVGGDQRQIVPVGEIDGRGLERPVVAGEPLELDIEPVAEQVPQRQQPLLGLSRDDRPSAPGRSARAGRRSGR